MYRQTLKNHYFHLNLMYHLFRMYLPILKILMSHLCR
jgi:hypothetical protein